MRVEITALEPYGVTPARSTVVVYPDETTTGTCFYHRGMIDATNTVVISGPGRAERTEMLVCDESLDKLVLDLLLPIE